MCYSTCFTRPHSFLVCRSTSDGGALNFSCHIWGQYCTHTWRHELKTLIHSAGIIILIYGMMDGLCMWWSIYHTTWPWLEILHDVSSIFQVFFFWFFLSMTVYFKFVRLFSYRCVVNILFFRWILHECEPCKGCHWDCISSNNFHSLSWDFH